MTIKIIIKLKIMFLLYIQHKNLIVYFLERIKQKFSLTK
jgi:hypothetical protein